MRNAAALGFGVLTRRGGIRRSLPRVAVRLASSSASVSSGAASFQDGADRTFVSSHFRLEPDEVERYLRKRGLQYRISNGQATIRECPFCHPTRGKPDNLNTLGVSCAQGCYHCFRCGASGSWFDFQRRLSSGKSGSSSGPQRFAVDRNGRTMPNQRDAASYESALSGALEGAVGTPGHPRDEVAALVARYLLEERGLNADILRKYRVGAARFRFRDLEQGSHGAWRSYACMTFPWISHENEFTEQSGIGSDHDSRTPQHSTAGRRQHTGLGAREQQVQRLKVRSVEVKRLQRTEPAGGGSGLFGWHTVPLDADLLVITEGEFDAMAVHQATSLPAVSLPNGCRSLPVTLLPALERFGRIVLWLDADGPGQEGAEKIAKKLGPGRCKLVTPETMATCDSTALGEFATLTDSDDPSKPYPKDANEALRSGCDLGTLVASAKPLKHDKIVHFDDLRHALFEAEFASIAEGRGVPLRAFPSFNAMLKGHRPGELTIVTGATGSGKTTLLSQLSLDLCLQDVPTLWGSFEIKNTRLLSHMIRQFAHSGGLYYRGPPSPDSDFGAGFGAAGMGGDGGGLSGDHAFLYEDAAAAYMGVGKGGKSSAASAAAMERAEREALKRDNLLDLRERRTFDRYADEFTELPMYFMSFFGSTEASVVDVAAVDHVIETMNYARYVYDVEHVVLDNLQFMMNGVGAGIGAAARRRPVGNFERFEAQEAALDEFRKFATQHNVHVTLVIHPRKEDEGAPLSMASVFGTAKATQEADNVVIIQNSKEGKSVELKKNRYDGDLGRFGIAFNKEARSFAEEGPDAERYYRAAREEWDKVWGMGNPVDEGDDESAAPGQRDNDCDAFTESPASAQAER